MGNAIGSTNTFNRPFSYQCNNGHVITRIDTRSGDYVDALKVTCSDGTGSSWFGGPGGAPGSVESTDGITGFGGYGLTLVNNLKLRTGQGPSEQWTEFGKMPNNYSVDKIRQFTCPQGNALYKVDGGGTQYLDRLEFWCGPFSQKQAIEAAAKAAADAAIAAKLAAEAADRALKEAVAKALADERASIAAARAAAEQAAAEAAAKAAADAAAREAAQKIAFEAAVAAAAEKLAAELAARERATADAKAAAAKASAETAAADAAAAARHASDAISANGATAAGVAARAAEQSADNAASAAASAANPLVTTDDKSVTAHGGTVDATSIWSSYTWILFVLIVLIAIAVFMQRSAHGIGSYAQVK